MGVIGYRKEKHYSIDDNVIGDCAKEHIKNAIKHNNAVGTIIGYYDEALTIISVSDYLLYNLGYSIEEFKETAKGSLYNIICGENTSWAELDRFRDIHGAGEGEMLTSDGTPILVRLYKEDSVDENGKEIWILSVGVDWDRENLALVNEAIKSGPWYMECSNDGEIQEVRWSHEFRRMLGYHDIIDFPNELESWTRLLHPSDKEMAIRSLYDAIADKSNDTKFNIDYRIRMKDGEYQWYRNVAEIIRRRDGSARRIAGVFINVDKEKKGRMQIEKANALNRQMLEENKAMSHLINSMTRVVDHFAICDLQDNQYTYHNINIDSHYPKEGRYDELVDMVQAKFKLLDEAETLESAVQVSKIRENLTGSEDIYKFEYCDKEEDIFRIASFVPLEWNGNILTKVLWISMDITQEKKIEIESRKALQDAFFAAERANEAKTSFLSNMSHDIRTPMNAIVGLTAIAGANIDNPERVIDCLGKITKSSRHLLGLINEVLDMARIESGTISLVEEEFNISELVDSLSVLSKPGIEEHRHHFEINIMDIVHEDVYGDSLRIQQIFANLMSNAIKYTPDGGDISFTITEKPNTNSEYGCYEFIVEDNGIGMTEEFQKIMFQPFVRADDDRSTKVQGTGLGMTITQNIVNMMNGNIKVQSKPGEGTKVTVTIYLKMQSSEEDQIKELADLPVLVVDDDEACCEGTVATLSEIGIAGEGVTSGAEAIERTFERHERGDDYFAIIMDWKMPRLDGIETTRKIREKVGRDVTIIVLTAYDYSDIEDEARAAGVDAFISKPLFRSRLTATLKQIITGKSTNSARNYLGRIAKEDYSDKKILLVEDNELNREIAIEIIKMSNAQIDVACDGKEAVKKIAGAAEGTYDLVFMDIQMPVMNGYEATRAIRLLEGSRANIPIVAMTANAFVEDVQKAKNAGMNGHMAKPIDLDKLYDVLRKWLR